MKTVILAADDAASRGRGAALLRQAGFQLLEEPVRLADGARAVNRCLPDAAVVHLHGVAADAFGDLELLVRAQHPKACLVLASTEALADGRLGALGGTASVMHEGGALLALRWLHAALGALQVAEDALGRQARSRAGLTPREHDVLGLLRAGRTTKDIASLLNMSTRTVDFHRANIKHKLQLRTGAELIAFASRLAT